MKRNHVGARRYALLLILPAFILAGCSGSGAVNVPATPPSSAPAVGTSAPNAASPQPAISPVLSPTPSAPEAGASPQSTGETQQATSAAGEAPVTAAAPAATTVTAAAPAASAAPVAPATPVAAATSTAPATPGASAAVTATQTVSETQSAGGGAAANVLYQDDFKDPASGWPDELVFQDYYVGYHEPDYYHVEVHVPSDSAIVSAPGHTFDNFDVESRVLVSIANTAPNGDFRYGLAIRRAGNRYYAFTISPRSQRWFVLKSGAGNLRVLDQGGQVAIQGLKTPDTLRVDAQGPVLTFWINGALVSQINDPDYTAGEVGFYVETVDSPKAHIHFDSLIVEQPQNPPPPGPTATPAPVATPSLACTVTVNLLRMRAAPRAGDEPTIAGLFLGTQLDATGRNADGSWLWVRIHGQDQAGWVSAQPGLVSCNGEIGALAIATPRAMNTTRTP